MTITIYREPLCYEAAVEKMEGLVDGIVQGKNTSTVWLLEHMPVYTVGYTTYSSWISRYGNSICGIPLVESRRGGQITYHGPGQRIIYTMIDLRNKYGAIDLRKFLNDVHKLIIDVLAEFEIEGIVDPDYPGVWVRDGRKLSKVGAVGIRVTKGVSYHGVALNVNTDLKYFSFIEPCGINDANRGMTSLQDILGRNIQPNDIDDRIVHHVKKIWEISKSTV